MPRRADAITLPLMLMARVADAARVAFADAMLLRRRCQDARH